MGPPFDRHPTSAADIRATAEGMSRSKGQLTGVMNALDGPGQRAADAVDGTIDGHIRGPVDLAQKAAMEASAGALLCKDAVELYADHVEIFDRAVDDINTRWENAKKQDFFVADDAADRDAAVEAARGAEAAALRKEYARVEEALDVGAQYVATALNAGPKGGTQLLTAMKVQTTSALADLRRPEYLALGDSYSAGTGIGDYYTKGSEFRSTQAYAWLLAERFGLRLSHQATNGATTEDIDRLQLSGLGPDTKFVTLTAGGNNVDFSSVINAAATSYFDSNEEIEGARTRIRDELPAELNALYTEIRQRAPNATIVVGTYPRFFDGETGLRKNLVGSISTDEEKDLNAAADEIDDLIRRTAEAHGFEVADVREEFAGHGTEEGTDDRWVDGIVLNPGDGEIKGVVDFDSYHPNVEGHRGYADDFEEHFRR